MKRLASPVRCFVARNVTCSELCGIKHTPAKTHGVSPIGGLSLHVSWLTFRATTRYLSRPNPEKDDQSDQCQANLSVFCSAIGTPSMHRWVRVLGFAVRSSSEGPVVQPGRAHWWARNMCSPPTSS